MDRSLNHEQISLALGQHGNLPSPEQLAELLATAELNLLLHQTRMSPELEPVGWYLHGVASSKYALETYGIERQRAAFQVAAHIFDLLMHDPEKETSTRLKYCFAAQIAYLRSRLDPNALAVYRRIVDLGEPGILSQTAELALSSGVAFLGLDLDYIYTVVRNARDQIRQLVSEWGVQDIHLTPFGSAAGVVLGTWELTTFLTYGRREALDRARDQLAAATIAEYSQQDHISRWVAAHLLNLATDLDNSSIWTVLPPEVPPTVRRAFAMGTPRILTLWPPQLELFQRKPNPLSADAKRLFISTPTSGGKTLLAQLLVTTHLALSSTSVCYIAPTRSLCREIRNSLSARLRLMRKRIVGDLPEGEWVNEIIDSDPDVEVMTPERLSYLMHTDCEQLLNRFGMFIFDEVHLIGDASRGWTLEEELTYLHYRTQNTEHRIVLISAVIGNRHHFIQWLGESVIPLESNWRGPRRLHAIWTTEFGDWEERQLEPISRARKYTHRVYSPKYGRLNVRLSNPERIIPIFTRDPVGMYVQKIHDKQNDLRTTDQERTTSFREMMVPVIRHMAVFGPVLVIESSRNRAAQLAKTISSNIAGENAASEDSDTSFTPPQNLQPLIDLVEARLGTLHPLGHVLRYGVAYHHGSLPSEIREAIEDAVVQGNLRYLVATTTMAEGVNLPVHSVVIASLGIHTSDGYEEFIKGSKLVNAIGRAGRATKETEGVVVLALQNPDPEDFNRLDPDESELEVRSFIATEQALNELAEFEEAQRSSEDLVFSVAEGVVSDFIQFVWFIAAQFEKLGMTPTQQHIGDVLNHSFAWMQLPQDVQDKWLSVAEETRSSYLSSNPQTRRRWASTGTSVSSARQIEGIVRDLITSFSGLPIPQNPLEAVNMVCGEDRLERMLSLPESRGKPIFNQRGGQNRIRIEIDVRDILLKWLSGATLIELADAFFAEVSDVDYRFEQLGDFIKEYFEVFLPWVVSTIVGWANEYLAEHASEELLPIALPAYIRWGVGNPTALKLILDGVQSRTLAQRIAVLWEIETEDVDISIRDWIRSKNLDEWRNEFRASVADLRNLLEYCRDYRGGIAVDLIYDEQATFEVQSFVGELSQQGADLKSTGDSAFAPIGIWVESQLVGQIPSKDQTDIQNILNIGLMIDAKFSASENRGKLELTLIDPDR
jgi:hypothetical protein